MAQQNGFTVGPISGSPTRFKEISDAVQLYLDLLYTCDVSLLNRVFHEGAQLCTLEDGKPLYRSIPEYREVLRTRMSPQSQGATRQEHLVNIDLASETQAMVKVQMRVNQFFFSDYLVFFRMAGEWRIVAKTYHRTEVTA